MLFDLRGRRRRVVQATYLMLALLLGGGLVLFGIGGDVSGGLFNAFEGDGGGGGDATEAVEEQIDRQEKRLARDPQNAAVLAGLTRSYYNLAAAQIPSGGTFPEEAKDDLRRAATYWERYSEAVDRPDPSLAALALQMFDPTALNQPDRAKDAALIVAERTDDPSAYLRVVQYATAANDKRTADLAAQKAVELAPKDQRQAVKQQIKAFRQAQQSQQAQPQGG
jgi:hypothetical protein